MRTSLGANAEQLATCHGFTVVAGGETVGDVETPTFAQAGAEPDYLIVRTCAAILGTFRVVPVSRVEAVEPSQRLILLEGSLGTVAALPERLPLGRSERGG
jgi:hypothetical protein